MNVEKTTTTATRKQYVRTLGDPTNAIVLWGIAVMVCCAQVTNTGILTNQFKNFWKLKKKLLLIILSSVV